MRPKWPQWHDSRPVLDLFTGNEISERGAEALHQTPPEFDLEGVGQMKIEIAVEQVPVAVEAALKGDFVVPEPCQPAFEVDTNPRNIETALAVGAVVGNEVLEIRLIVGKVKLYINDKAAAEGDLRTQLGKFTLAGDGLRVGYDSGDAVSQEYTTPGTFKGGSIRFVEVAVDTAQYLDREMELKRALHD